MENHDRRKEYTREDINDIVISLWSKMKEAVHNEPSPKTLELISGLKENLDKIQTTLCGMENKGGLIEKIDNMSDKIDDLTAKKNFSTGAVWIISAVLVGIVCPFLYWIGQKTVDNAQDIASLTQNK